MYISWGKLMKLQVSIVDSEDSGNGGYRFVLLKVTGSHCFGWMSAEAGVHRLVRISPFDPQHKRHTSFAQVVVFPQCEEKIQSSNIMSSNEYKIDTFKSSGPGGQHVNTTDSAVRITHLPTKTVVTCQSERSQLRNRETAMTIMRSKLQELNAQLAKAQRDASSLGGEADSWGNQIRSTVLSPYTLVKDHRTKWETSNTAAFLRGELLQDTMEAVMLHQHMGVEL
jgi:peptide chain release factor 2